MSSWWRRASSRMANPSRLLYMEFERSIRYPNGGKVSLWLTITNWITSESLRRISLSQSSQNGILNTHFEPFRNCPLHVPSRHALLSFYAYCSSSPTRKMPLALALYEQELPRAAYSLSIMTILSRRVSPFQAGLGNVKWPTSWLHSRRANRIRCPIRSCVVPCAGFASAKAQPGSP